MASADQTFESGYKKKFKATGISSEWTTYKRLEVSLDKQHNKLTPIHSLKVHQTPASWDPKITPPLANIVCITDRTRNEFR